MDFLNFPDPTSGVLEVINSWDDPLPELNDEPDQFHWLGSPSGNFTAASAWDNTRPRSLPKQWAPFIWNSSLAPRFQFLLWLITKNRLPTQVLLLTYGCISVTNCGFCSYRPDSVDHLFFGCPIPSALAIFWAARFNFAWRNNSWLDNLLWAIKYLYGASFRSSLA